MSLQPRQTIRQRHRTSALPAPNPAHPAVRGLVQELPLREGDRWTRAEAESWLAAARAVFFELIYDMEDE